MASSSAFLIEILADWAAKKQPTQYDWRQLAAWELADTQRATAFGITMATVEEAIYERASLFQRIINDTSPNLPWLKGKIGWGSLPSSLLETLWRLWLPLAIQLAAHRKSLPRPLIQGMLGGQGTGKTTLAITLVQILEQLGCRTLRFSLDDLYKTYPERQHLQIQDPRLIWRGPPGTHDVELGIKVLEQLRQPLSSDQVPHPIKIPRFDKSAWEGAGDRTLPEVVTDIDIVLFEGWFVGVQPWEPLPLQTLLEEDLYPPIVTPADRQFALDMNLKLQDYLPLWEQLDQLMILHPTDYRLSLQWRKQAEHEMIASGKSGMSDAEIEQFVQYFWKALHPELFIKPLIQNSMPQKGKLPIPINLVIEISRDHTISEIYQPLKNIENEDVVQ